MAIYTVNANGALVANTTKSMILLNPVAKLLITHLDVSFDESAAAKGVRVDLYRVTTLGSAAGTSQTPKKFYEPDGASAVTTLVNLTTEPTAVDVIQSWYVQPFGGLLPLDAVLDHEVGAAAGGARLGLRWVNPSGGSTCNYQAGLAWSE